MSARVTRIAATAAVAWAATGHTSLGPGPVESPEQIQGRARPDLGVPRQLQVPRGGREMAVPHQTLNRVQIHAGFEQMGREAMAQHILTLPTNRPQPPSTTVTIRSTENR